MPPCWRSVSISGFPKRIIRVQVAVFLLRGGDFANPVIAFGFQGGIRIIDKRISHSFQRLVNVGIVKIIALVLPSFRHVYEIPDPMGLILNLVDAHGNRDIVVLLQPGTPKFIMDGHLGEIHGHHGFPLFRSGVGSAGR